MNDNSHISDLTLKHALMLQHVTRLRGLRVSELRRLAAAVGVGEDEGRRLLRELAAAGLVAISAGRLVVRQEVSLRMTAGELLRILSNEEASAKSQKPTASVERSRVRRELFGIL